MPLIDTHCHIDVADFSDDRDAVLSRCRQSGVGALVVPAVVMETIPDLLELCRNSADLYPALGLHPVYLASHRPQHVEELGRLVDREQPVAIGEIGLDYFVENFDAEGQQQLFEQQLGIAKENGLPVLLHIRKAHDRVLATLRRMGFRNGGIAHAFNGSRQQAEQFMDLGFKLGFGGVTTYERARKIRRLAAALPLSALVLETDAPDLTPASHHGERNSPEFLPEILATVAALRDEAPEVVAAATTANAIEVMPRLAPNVPSP